MGTKIIVVAGIVLGFLSLWTINPSAAAERGGAIQGEDYVKVEVRGTLRTGIMAIGGETTGTTVSGKGMTFEVELGNHQKLRSIAEKLDGRKVVVRGSLERKKGVEIRERWIIMVTDLQPAN